MNTIHKVLTELSKFPIESYTKNKQTTWFKSFIYTILLYIKRDCYVKTNIKSYHFYNAELFSFARNANNKHRISFVKANNT